VSGRGDFRRRRRARRPKDFTAINAELSKQWKPIIERKPAPPDADDWKEVKPKRHLLER
jgi:ferredoxin